MTAPGSRPVPAHYLRQNHGSHTPRRVIALDTETLQRPSNLGRIHTFRLGCATFDRRGDRDWTDGPDDAVTITEDPAPLWDWVDAHTDRNESTWLYAHHLAFDLAVSKGLPELTRLGWEVTLFSTMRGAAYVRLRNGRRRLTMADSHSWLPTTVEDIGRRIGLPKFTAPWKDPASAPESWQDILQQNAWPSSPEDPNERWAVYCRRDTDIVRQAMLELMQWWDSSDFGRWGLTGAQSGWAVYRHRYLTTNVLVHRDDDATELERAAYYGGRREMFRHGEVAGGPFPYLDYKAHYADVARRTPVPVALLHVSDKITVDSYTDVRGSLGLIAEVEVRTQEPNIPVRTPEGITYPVGQFITTLAGPELDLAIDTGHVVRILRGAVYKLAPVLKPWATWAIQQSDPETSTYSKLAQLVVKGWTRSVIGKFGQTGRETHRIGDTLKSEFSTEGFHNVDTDARGTITKMCGGIYQTTNGTEPDNAIPAIAAWVNSTARVELWQLMNAVGRENVIWCDTDAVIADGSARADPRTQGPPDPETGRAPILDPSWWIDQPELDRLPGRLAVKAVHHTLTLHLPGEYVLDGRHVVKGVPSGALPVAPRTFEVELWPGLGWQMTAHGAAAFETWNRTYASTSTYDRAQLLPDGHVMPLDFLVIGEHNTRPIPSIDAQQAATILAARSRAP